jgi:cytochrome P450
VSFELRILVHGLPDIRRMEWQWQIPIAKYGEGWRQGRKLLDRSLRPGAAAMYRPMQQTRVRVLLTRLLGTPDEWRDHIELCVIVCIFKNDLSIHISFKLSRRAYFGHDVWVRSQGAARQKAGCPQTVDRVLE